MVFPVFPIPKFKRNPQNRFYYGDDPYDIALERHKKSFSKSEPTTVDSAVKVTLSSSALRLHKK